MDWWYAPMTAMQLRSPVMRVTRAVQVHFRIAELEPVLMKTFYASAKGELDVDCSIRTETGADHVVKATGKRASCQATEACMAEKCTHTLTGTDHHSWLGTCCILSKRGPAYDHRLRQLMYQLNTK